MFSLSLHQYCYDDLPGSIPPIVGILLRANDTLTADGEPHNSNGQGAGDVDFHANSSGSFFGTLKCH